MTKTTICSLSFLSATPSPPEERPCITRVRLRITDWNVIEREDGEKEQVSEKERKEKHLDGTRVLPFTAFVFLLPAVVFLPVCIPSNCRPHG